MFGFNSEQVYKDELGALNNRRTDIEFDLGDRARQIYGSLIGKDYSKEGLLKGAAEIANRKLTDAYGGKAAAAKATLGPLASQYQGVEGKTTQEIEADLAIDQGRAKALETVMANNPDFDPSSLSSSASAGAIYGAGAKATKASNTAETRRLEDRMDAREAKEDRIRAEQRRDDLELRRDDLMFRKEEAIRADRRLAQDRKDKAIAMLFSGLGNLGSAFAL